MNKVGDIALILFAASKVSFSVYSFCVSGCRSSLRNLPTAGIVRGTGCIDYGTKFWKAVKSFMDLREAMCAGSSGIFRPDVLICFFVKFASNHKCTKVPLDGNKTSMSGICLDGLEFRTV